MNNTNSDIGKNACVELIGKEYVREHCDVASFAVQEINEDKVFCFLGIDLHEDTRELRLSNVNDWDVYASCYVEKGIVKIDEYKLPE